MHAISPRRSGLADRIVCLADAHFLLRGGHDDLLEIAGKHASLGEAEILDALRHVIDPVFLPRRLRLVDTRPRSETDKLPRVELMRD